MTSSYRGSVFLVTLVFLGVFITVTTSLIGSLTAYGRAANHAVTVAQALALAEGALDKAAYELNRNPSYEGEVNTPLAPGDFSIAVSTIDSSNKKVTVTGTVSGVTKTISAILATDSSVATFRYGVQSDAGGVHLKNSASVHGNVFSNGFVTGQNSNIVRGDVISAGPSGLIDGIYATSSGYARTIRNSTIDQDAHYEVISNTTVGGIQYSGSTSQATADMPITDTQVEGWKADAGAGGTYTGTCPYTITSSVILEPLKIPCNVTISGTPTITLTGPLWIVGNLEIQNTAHIRVADFLAGRSIAIVADNPANPSSSGKIILKNSVIVTGAGTDSYVLFLSQNRSAESGGSVTAIEVQNSVSGDLLVYAGHGKIILKNSIHLKEVSAYRIEVENSAEIVYTSGLTNTLFNSGPGGSWVFKPGTYVVSP